MTGRSTKLKRAGAASGARERPMLVYGYGEMIANRSFPE
jgi:hypothetical protein